MIASDTLAEWLRRRPAKPMGSPRVGSNPTGVDLFMRRFFPRDIRLGCSEVVLGASWCSWGLAGGSCVLFCCFCAFPDGFQMVLGAPWCSWGSLEAPACFFVAPEAPPDSVDVLRGLWAFSDGFQIISGAPGDLSCGKAWTACDGGTPLEISIVQVPRQSRCGPRRSINPRCKFRGSPAAVPRRPAAAAARSKNTGLKVPRQTRGTRGGPRQLRPAAAAARSKNPRCKSRGGPAAACGSRGPLDNFTVLRCADGVYLSYILSYQPPTFLARLRVPVLRRESIANCSQAFFATG